MKSIFRIATLGGIEASKNVPNYTATAETMLGTLVLLNDTNKTFTAVASADEAKAAEYALWQYPNADAHSVLIEGTNFYTVKEGQFGRLLYLPALKGLKDGVEMGGDIVTGTPAVGNALVANASGLYEVAADTTGYAVSYKIHEIIEEHDGLRYICEVIA